MKDKNGKKIVSPLDSLGGHKRKPHRVQRIVRRECPNCGNPYYRDKVNGDNRVARCPACGKKGCTVCVEMTETKTCCYSPE